MDNVRRLSELVDGQVEHVQALAKLSKGSPTWKSIIEFLCETELNSSHKIGAIRQLVRDFDECDDESALKKRYLQVRVARAATTKTNLSKQDLLKQLEKRRSALVSQIATTHRRVEDIKGLIRQKSGQSLALEALEQWHESVNLLKNSTVERLQPFTTKVQFAPKATASSLASIKNAIEAIAEGAEGNDQQTDTTTAMESLLSQVGFDQVLASVVTVMEQAVHSFKMPESTELCIPKGMMNVQQIALTLAKLLILLKSRKSTSHVQVLLHQLQSAQTMTVLSHTDDSNLLKGKRAMLLGLQERLSRVEEEIVKSTILVREKLQAIVETSDQLNNGFNSEYDILSDAREKVKSPNLFPDGAAMVCDPPGNLLDPTGAEIILKNLSGIDREAAGQFCRQTELLAEREKSMNVLMNALQARIGHLEGLFEGRAALFSEECRALEGLQSAECQVITGLVQDSGHAGYI